MAQVQGTSPEGAFSAVAESSLALARAELRLATVEAWAWLSRLGWGLGLLWLGLLLTQVFALLAALSPLLLSIHPWPAVVATLSVSLVLAAVVLGFAARELRKVKP